VLDFSLGADPDAQLRVVFVFPMLCLSACWVLLHISAKKLCYLPDPRSQAKELVPPPELPERLQTSSNLQVRAVLLVLSARLLPYLFYSTFRVHVVCSMNEPDVAHHNPQPRTQSGSLVLAVPPPRNHAGA